MKFYTIISTMQNTRSAIAIFTEYTEADRYLKSYDDQARIEEWNIDDGYKYPNPVYAAHAYDEINDGDKFIGLFSTDELARSQECPGKKNIEVKELIPNEDFS